MGYDKDKGMAKNKKTKSNAIKWILLIALILVVAFGLWMLSGIGDKPSEKVVLTVGEEEVRLDEIYFGIVQNVTNLGITKENIENMVTEDGSNAEDYYKDQIIGQIVNYKVEYQVAKEQGITLTEEEEKEIRADVIGYLGAIDARILNRWEIKQELIEEVFTQQYLAEKLEESVIKDIAVEEQRFCTIYMMLFPKIKMAEDGNYVRQEDGQTPILLSEEEIMHAKENAELALQELQSGADVAEVAKKYGVEMYSEEEGNLEESFEEPFSEYVKTLKENECSPVIETEAFFAIVKMISENNEAYAEQILSYYQADLEAAEIETQRVNWYKQIGASEEPEFVDRTWEKISLFDFVQ